MIRIKRSDTLLRGFLILGLLFLILRKYSKSEPPRNGMTLNNADFLNTDVVATVNENIKNRVMSELAKQGFSKQTAEDIFSQAAFETGNFTSRIFRENYNLFGMKQPKIRPTKATGTRYEHAIFNSLEDSVADYRLYWEYFKYPEFFQTVGDFVTFLKKKKYFEADFEQYLSGVKFYKKLYFNE